MNPEPPIRRIRPVTVVLLVVVLVIVAAPRFAGGDRLGTGFFAGDRYYTYELDSGRTVEKLNIDRAQYLAMIEKQRGVEGAFEKQEPYPQFASNPDAVKGPVAPFIERPVLPAIAAMLPFDPDVSFSLVNLFFLAAGLVAIVDSLAVRRFSPTAQFVGGLLYAVSLPVLVFGATLYIDSGTVGVLAIGVWLLARRWWLALALFLPLSYAIKESIFVLAPVAAAAWYSDRRSFKDVRFISGAVAVVVGWVALALVIRQMTPDPVLSYTVTPKWSYFGGNLGQIASAAFFVLGTSTVVVPALFGLRSLVRDPGKRAMWRSSSSPDLVGCVVVIALNAYSIVSTDLTLRTGWLIFPFAIGLAAVWIDRSTFPARQPDWLAAISGERSA